MKKYLLTGCLLAALAVVMLVGAQVWVNGMQDDVDLIETVYEGDHAAAEGVTIDSDTLRKDNLFWKSSYTVTKNGTLLKTKFSIDNTPYPNAERSDEPPVALDYLSQITIFHQEELDRVNKDSLSAKIMNDVFSRAKPDDNGEYTEIIHLKDYTKYFPVRLVALEARNSVDDANMPLFEEFKIPVPDDAISEVKVRAESKNTLAEYSYTEGGYLLGYTQLSGDDCYVLPAELCYTTDIIYHQEDESSELVTKKLAIPKDLRGIFHVTMGTPDENGNRFPVSGTASMLYALPDGAKVLGMEASPSGKELYLFTVENGRVYLSVVIKASGICLQKIPLMDALNDDYYFGMKVKENKVFAVLGNYRFALLTIEKDGTLTKEVSDTLEYGNTSYCYELNHMDFDCKGNKLAVAVYNGQQGSDDRLYVFEKGRLKYMGSYRPSFRRSSEWSDHYFQDKKGPLKVSLT